MNSTHALAGGPRPVTTRLTVVAGLVAVLTIAALAPAAASAQALRPSVVVKPNLMPVKGYKYVAAPASFDSFVSSLVSTGLITGAVIKGAKDKKDIQDIVMLAQYKPKTSKALDKKPLKSILDGMVAGMQAVGGTKAVDHVLVGTHVRSISVQGLIVVVAYIKTGKLLEVFGPTTKGTLAFTKLYLTSAKAHGQKLG